MKFVRAPFGGDVDHAARVAAVLGAETVGLHAKLGDGILAWYEDRCIAVSDVDGDAVI